jgi:CRISPR-associated protein Cmr2
MDTALDLKTADLIAIAWCMAWGSEKIAKLEVSILKEMRQALLEGQDVPDQVAGIVDIVKKAQTIQDFPTDLERFVQDHPELCDEKTPIGLVYGGATKIKGYVFEGAKLSDIRGASALLDRINLLDLPAFFDKYTDVEKEKEWGEKVHKWLEKKCPELAKALCPEMIIYSTGGNILAFCPAAFVDDLANLIEFRYTTETLTANSCAVGRSFQLLEFQLGRLKENIAETLSLDWFKKNKGNHLVSDYYGKDEATFKQRKSFNELVGVLASDFNRRRAGNETQNRPSRQYPPMFETHPYLKRDESDSRSAIAEVPLPDNPYFSETLARKRIVGQLSKNEKEQKWYDNLGLAWEPGYTESWVRKFKEFLEKEENKQLKDTYYRELKLRLEDIVEANSLQEIASNGFVGYIYADGNNMGGYIQKIHTAEQYRKFSQDVTKATTQAVYIALATHLNPSDFRPETRENPKQLFTHIHPFEILTVGGDDVLLIVPANRALQIAKTIGEEFERILLLNKSADYRRGESKSDLRKAHRYQAGIGAEPDRCLLSMSSAVLITAENTPIYYAQKLYDQLLKSAKKCAKDLRKSAQYFGGTIDFLSLKSVTMLSDNIGAFREAGLTKKIRDRQKLKLYAAPYTLFEIGGLISTISTLKKADFPRSQLYQIRSLIEQGKETAMLNYRYFRVRLKKGQKELKADFEEAWCKPKDKNNNGNLAPWMTLPEKEDNHTVYETIWRDMVDLYPFIDESETEIEAEILQSPAEAEK